MRHRMLLKNKIWIINIQRIVKWDSFTLIRKITARKKVLDTCASQREIETLRKETSSQKSFEKIEGANIQTNAQMAKENLKKIVIDSDESIISLDLKIMYTNVPHKEALKK